MFPFLLRRFPSVAPGPLLAWWRRVCRWSPRGENRRRAWELQEQALRESEARFRACFEQAAVGMAQVGLDGRWLRVNQKLCDIVGYTREELLARTFQDLTHPDDLKADLGGARRLTTGEIQTYSVEKRYLRRDGSVVWVNLTVSLGRDAVGAPGYFISVIEDITARRRTEELLRESHHQLEDRVAERTAELGHANTALAAEREFLHAVFDHAPVGIAVCDADGRLTHFNHAATEHNDGLTYAPVPAERWAEYFGLYQPDGVTLRAKEEIPLWRALQGETVSGVEFTLWPPVPPATDQDGPPAAPRTLMLDARPIRDADGRLLGALAISEDVTARRQAEAARQVSEARFRAFMDNTPPLAWIKDAEGRFLYTNRAVQQTFGKSEAELLGQSDTVLINDPERVRQIRANDRMVLESGQTTEFEESEFTPDGVMNHWLSCKFLVEDADGRRHVGAMAQNITARVRAEEAMREAVAQTEREKRFSESLTNLAPNVIYVFDLETMTNVYANRDLSEYLGYSLAQMQALGREFIPATAHPDDLEFLYRHLKDFRGGSAHGVVEFTARFRSAAGEWRWFAHRETVFRRHADGTPHQIIGVAQDVTHLKQTEADLVRAREEALEAARAKSEFLANMSHEIRTPLNGVIGMADLLADTELNEVQRDYVRTVQDCGTGLLRVINDILDFSKIEAGKLELEEVDFGSVALVEGQAALLTACARAKNLSLLTYVDPALPATLRGDPGRLGQVLLNLLNNAVKFTPEGGTVVARAVRVPSSFLEEPTGGGDLRREQPSFRLRVSVQDTGIGLSEAARLKLFQPFTQADGSTTRRYGGTGLGLSICKRLVDLMHGQIGVESTPGEGTTFWFEVPLAPAAPPVVANSHDDDYHHDADGRMPGQPSPAADHRDAERPPAPGRRRVLVVEDCPVAARIFGDYLRSWGLEVRAVGTGAEALVELRRQAAAGLAYDLALVDKQLPEAAFQGFSLARAIRQDPALHDDDGPALVLVSAFDRPSQRQDALEAGFAAYLPKPVRKTELHRVVFQVLGERRPFPPATAARTPRSSHAPPVNGNETTAPTGDRPPRRFTTNRDNDGGGAPRGGRRILVAEDNAVNQRLILTQLKSLGHAARAVDDGRQVLDALEKDRDGYDLILMDCQMPEMDGLEVADRIRQRERQQQRHHGVHDDDGASDHHRIPIVALTASALAEDRERCLRAGMDDYLAKPVRKEQLAAVIERWLTPMS